MSMMHQLDLLNRVDIAPVPIRSLLLEELAKEVDLLWTDRPGALRDQPVQPSISTWRNRRGPEVVPEIKWTQIVEVFTEVESH